MALPGPIAILGCLYNDWASADELFRALGAESQRRQLDLQLILVDDGSLMAPPAAFLQGSTGFSSVEVVRLRRNVGHQRALAIGLSHIFETKQPESVVVMDCDGEDRPDDVFRLLEAHSRQEESKIIFAERTRRSEGAIFRLFYQFYCLFHVLLTGYRIRFGNFSIVPNRWLGCLVVDPNLWLHFAATVVAGRIPYTTIPTKRGVRLHGHSKLNFTSLVIHGLAAISCYSEIVGVRLLFCSSIMSIFIVALIVTVLLVRITTLWAVPGWATYTVGILFIILVQAQLIVPAFSAVAISNRKAHFFFPVQQYKLLVRDIQSIL